MSARAVAESSFSSTASGSSFVTVNLTLEWQSSGCAWANGVLRRRPTAHSTGLAISRSFLFNLNSARRFIRALGASADERNAMKYILVTLLILSSAALAVEALPNQKLLAIDLLNVQKTKSKLDSRIRPVDPRKYEDVRDGNDWLNPYLVIRPEGYEVISRAPSVERKVVPRDGLKKMLVSLPVSAWPYGRAMGVQEISIRSGAPNSEVWRKDEGLIRKNKLAANKVLASLGIKIKWWPSN